MYILLCYSKCIIDIEIVFHPIMGKPVDNSTNQWTLQQRSLHMSRIKHNRDSGINKTNPALHSHPGVSTP